MEAAGFLLLPFFYRVSTIFTGGDIVLKLRIYM